jgi:hypothetical protein
MAMHGSQMIYAITFIVLQGCDPALTALFTPIRPTLGRYEVCASEQRIDQTIADGAAEGATYSTPDLIDALDAFGWAGSYDRSAVAQLYGGLRPSVAHGWRRTADHFESITLISPHPDASLSRLLPGTLTIRWIIQE